MQKAQSYLEANLDQAKDSPYALALATLTLEKLKSNLAGEALASLLHLAKQDENGIYWEENPIALEKTGMQRIPVLPHSSKNVETTSYAALALIEAKDSRASSALKWISSQRNSRGGFSSTQDTVIAFKALMTAAAMQGKDIDAKITINVDGNRLKELSVGPENFDVLQVVEIPPNSKQISLSLSGKGEVNYQIVKKYHMLLPEIPPKRELELNVTYNASHVSVNDIVDVIAKVRYVGETPNTGMLLLDIAVPTGFTPVTESLDSLRDKKIISRYEIAGRKIILYIDGLAREEELEINLKIKALFPVKAIIPDSRAYSYYNPEVKAEGKGGKIEVA
jgi:CD109 antigen